MRLANSLRIDTAICSTSLWRLGLYVVLTGAMVILAWFASLVLWQYVSLLIVTAAVTAHVALSDPIPLHISQPPLNQRADKGWQLLLRTGRGDELWQADLIEIYGCRWVISLRFMVIEPYRQPLSVTIFCDQVSPEHWRELSVLATVAAGTKK